MANDKIGSKWSILRDAVYGKLTNPQSLDGRPFSISSDGFKANRRKQDFVLHHGIIILYQNLKFFFNSFQCKKNYSINFLYFLTFKKMNIG